MVHFDLLGALDVTVLPLVELNYVNQSHEFLGVEGATESLPMGGVPRLQIVVIVGTLVPVVAELVQIGETDSEELLADLAHSKVEEVGLHAVGHLIALLYDISNLVQVFSRFCVVLHPA